MKKRSKKPNWLPFVRNALLAVFLLVMGAGFGFGAGKSIDDLFKEKTHQHTHHADLADPCGDDE